MLSVPCTSAEDAEDTEPRKCWGWWSGDEVAQVPASRGRGGSNSWSQPACPPPALHCCPARCRDTGAPLDPGGEDAVVR